MEAPSLHADEPDQGKSHDHDEVGRGQLQLGRELPDHGVLDMGMGDDVPQETPGMEVDLIMETSLTSRTL